MRKFRGFCAAFAVTLCVLGLGVGLYTVGYNSRRMTEGDKNGEFTVENGKIHLTSASGKQLSLAPIDETAHTAPLCPAPARVTLQLLRGVAALADGLAEKLTNP